MLPPSINFLNKIITLYDTSIKQKVLIKRDIFADISLSLI